MLLPMPYARGVTHLAWKRSERIIRAIKRKFPYGRPHGGQALKEWREMAGDVITPGDIYRGAIATLLDREYD